MAVLDRNRAGRKFRRISIADTRQILAYDAVSSRILQVMLI